MLYLHDFRTYVYGLFLNVMFPCLDNRCFETSLVGHKDSGLFTYGQLNNFIRKLCYRSLLPKHLPKDTVWTQLPVLRTSELRQLSSREFLNRLKLKEDLDKDAAAKVKPDHSDKEGPIPNRAKLVEECKERFVGKARGHIVFLLEKSLSYHRINAEIVRGMASFDPHILFSLPQEQATHCFVALYKSFSLRGWLEGSTEDDCRDEYLEFIDQFRLKYASLKDSPDGFTDMIELLSGMSELRNRPHLYCMYRLCCLCLTENTPLLPLIRFQDVDAQSTRCRMGDVLQPAQSYLARVPKAITVCTNDDSLAKYREVEEQFNSGNVTGDPWVYVDTFGRTEFYKPLHDTYKSTVRVPKSASSSRSGSRSSSPSNSGRRKPSPGKGKKKVAFGPTMTAKEDKSIRETTPYNTNS